MSSPKHKISACSFSGSCSDETKRPARERKTAFPVIGARVILAALLFAFLFTFGSCKKDPDEFPEKYLTYLYFCPDGKAGCYAGCVVAHDDNDNGSIDDLELPDYNSCTGECDVSCDTSFMLLLLEDD